MLTLLKPFFSIPSSYFPLSSTHVPLRHAFQERAAVFDVHDDWEVGVAGFELLDHELLVRQAELVVVYGVFFKRERVRKEFERRNEGRPLYERRRSEATKSLKLK